jgi:hypothetical protein
MRALPTVMPQQDVREFVGDVAGQACAPTGIAGAQLSREPWQSAVLEILESVGEQLQALGVPEPEQFDCASALVNYILGLAGQYAAAARLLTPETD